MAEIKIVGTAHVSQQSVDEVRAAIENFKPDIPRSKNRPVILPSVMCLK
jgi:hypothetical protein